jgi:aryl-alcohol dehydrogenase-like predicted oxidoreductase
MQIDCIDILQLHNPSVEVCEQNKCVETLQELKRQGAIRFLGCSSTNPDLSTFIDWGVFDVFQIPYSALQREHENLITKAGEAGAGVIIRGGVARGEPGEGLGAKDRWKLFKKANLDEFRAPDENRTAFLLRFTLSHPHCHTTIVGTANPKHLEENIMTVMRGPLAPDIYEEVKQRLDAAGERPAEVA